MDLYTIATKLIGPIQPTGRHEADAMRLGNLEETTELIGRLVADVAEVADAAGSHEASVRDIGQEAREFLCDLMATLADYGAEAAEREEG